MEGRAAELLLRGGVAAEHVPKLSRYVELVLEAKRQFNLTGARTAEELVDHVLDSLTLTPYVRSPYIDVGSGAGFPGIPLAIVTGSQTTLLEATSRKADFLLDTLEALGVPAQAVVMRAEDAGRDPAWRGRYASATARAVASAPAVLELTAPFLALQGVALLQRGQMDEAERAALENAALILGCSVGAEIPLEGQKRLLLVRKTGETPSRFPRRAGIPEKRPLGGDVPRGTF